MLQNVITDYGIQCLNYPKKTWLKCLARGFQEDAQIAEKYHRATISQVQLCSYFTGATEINALREAYHKRKVMLTALKIFTKNS